MSDYPITIPPSIGYPNPALAGTNPAIPPGLAPSLPSPSPSIYDQIFDFFGARLTNSLIQLSQLANPEMMNGVAQRSKDASGLAQAAIKQETLATLVQNAWNKMNFDLSKGAISIIS
jgi:hypothetical protein